MPIRVAIDANVLITGIVWPRWQYEILQHALRDEFVLVLSPIVIAETRNRIVTTFPEFLPEFEFLIANLNFESAPVPTREEVAASHTLVRQSKDVPIALSIMSAKVDYFVTYDRDFTDEGETTRAVRQAIPGIVLPPVFLRDVLGWSSADLEAIRTREWTDLKNARP
jgi:putative PIN family toxin of toxin-antitoxin system